MNIDYTLHSIQYTLYRMYFKIYFVRTRYGTQFTTGYTIYTIHYIVYIHYTVYIIHTLYTPKFTQFIPWYYFITVCQAFDSIYTSINQISEAFHGYVRPITMICFDHVYFSSIHSIYTEKVVNVVKV